MNLAIKTSLRERKKTRRRSEILAAGRQLFVQQGYSSTSMEAIAELAEVGIATVYNYFGTKGRLLACMLQDDFSLLFEQGGRLVKQPPSEPGPGVLQLIDVYRKFQNNWQNKELLMAVIGPGLSADPALDELSIGAEHTVKKQLRDLLSGYQAVGSIRADIDIDDAAMIIFYIFNQHFIQFISQETMGYSEMKAVMDRQLSFIVQAIGKPIKTRIQAMP